MHSRPQLSDECRALGLEPGDVVMAHASVRAIGEIAGGPDQIHLALKDALTDDGTLLMYAGCPQYVDEVGRGNLSAEKEAEVLVLPDLSGVARQSAPGAICRVHANWPERFFATLVDAYLDASRHRGGRVGNAACHVLPARELPRFAQPVMERVAGARAFP